MRVINIFDRILNCFATAAAALLVLIMLIITADVSMRYVFSNPITGVQEVSEVMLLYLGFLSFAWLLRKEGHVTMDIVMVRLNLGTQSLLNIITSLIGAAMFSIITWYGVKITWQHYQAGLYTPTAVELPNAPILAIIPVGSFLLFIQFLRRSYLQLQRWKASKGKETINPA